MRTKFTLAFLLFSLHALTQKATNFNGVERATGGFLFCAFIGMMKKNHRWRCLLVTFLVWDGVNMHP